MIAKVALLALVAAQTFQWSHSRAQYSPGMFGLVGMLLVVAGSMAVVNLVTP